MFIFCGKIVNGTYPHSQGKTDQLGIINESLDADRRCCFNRTQSFGPAIYELISVQNDKKNPNFSWQIEEVSLISVQWLCQVVKRA